MPRVKIVARKNPQPSTPPVFESELAEQRFDRAVRKKLCCPEKGFLLDNMHVEKYPEFIISVIQRNNWWKLCNHSRDAYSVVVKEFYAHLLTDNQTSVYVRGMQVPFNSQFINQMYGLTVGEDIHEEFERKMTEEKFLKVVADVCIPGATHTKSPQGALSILRRYLTPDARVWYHFLTSSLKPTGHLTTVSQERAILLHSILQGRQIDIGRIILAEIKECAQKPRGKLYFPCLITRMCEVSGVFIDEADEQIPNTAAITRFTVNRVSQDGVAAEIYDVPEETEGPPTPPTEAAPSSPPAAAEPSSPPHEELNSEWSQRFNSMEATQAVMLEEIRQLRRDQRQQQNDQRAYWSYMRKWDNAVQQNLRANARKFYNFPRFPEEILNKPSSSDEE